MNLLCSLDVCSEARRMNENINFAVLGGDWNFPLRRHTPRNQGPHGPYRSTHFEHNMLVMQYERWRPPNASNPFDPYGANWILNATTECFCATKEVAAAAIVRLAANATAHTAEQQRESNLKFSESTFGRRCRWSRECNAEWMRCVATESQITTCKWATLCGVCARRACLRCN